MTQAESFDKMGRIRDEFDAGKFAIAQVLSDIRNNHKLSLAAQQKGVTYSELERCGINLEITFILRLFAEFEAILRDYWLRGIGRKTDPDMFTLMESIGHRRKINSTDLTMAHQIREFRNDIIHEGQQVLLHDLPRAIKCLGMYLRWLPLQW